MKTLIAILLVILVALHTRLWLGEGGMRTVRDLRKDIAHQEAENLVLVEKNRSLKAEVDSLARGGGEAVEERARSAMGMVRPDEIFVQTLETSPDAGSQ